MQPGHDRVSQVVTDGKPITGQNPGFSAAVADAVVAMLRGR